MQDQRGGAEPSGRDSDSLAFEETMRDPSARQALLATTTMCFGDGGLATVDASVDVLTPFATGYMLAGRWRIIERIGKGGFGFVYSAEDTELGGRVAIKTLRPEMEVDDEVIRQFKQEIQLARQVTHRNVCRIYDVGYHQHGALRIPFLSMELIEGQTLAQRVWQRGRLELEEIRRLILQIADALEAAHREGIVHADLKPGNVMVVEEEDGIRAVVTDFGLASVQSHTGSDEAATVVGTPAYMAPEQVEGKTLDPAADFFALGCTLYELLSGELPYVADTPVATAEARLVSKPLPVEEREPSLPSVWGQLCSRLLERDPRRRLSDAGELRLLLLPRAPGKSHSTRASIAIPIFSMAALAAMLFFMLRPKAPSLEPAGKRPEARVFYLSLPRDDAGALYEQGRLLWEMGKVEDAAKIWVDAVDEGHRHPLLMLQACRARRYLLRVAETSECYEEVRAVAESMALSEDERSFYRAHSLIYNGKEVEALKILFPLLERYQGSLELSLLVAHAQRHRGEIEECLATLQSVVPKNGLEWAEVQNSVISVLVESRRYEKAVEHVAQITERLRQLGAVRFETSILDQAATAARNLGRLDEATVFADRMMEIGVSVGSKRFQADSLSHRVAIAMKRNDFDLALAHAKKRQKLLELTGQLRGWSEMFIAIAEVQAAIGNPVEADETLSRLALPELRKHSTPYWEGYALAVRAGIRSVLGRHELAIEDCRAADAVFRGLQRKRLQAFAQVICGQNLAYLGRFEEANTCFEESRALRAELGLDVLLAQNDLAEAERWVLMEEWAQAEKSVRHAIELWADTEFDADRAVALELLSRALSGQARLAEARDALARAKAIDTGSDREFALMLQLADLRLDTDKSKSELRRALTSLIGDMESAGYGRLAREAGQLLERARQ